MSREHTVIDALHEATHHVPGVPEHRDRPRGHQEKAHHGSSLQNRPIPNRGAEHHHELHRGARTHTHRPPRVMVGWQNWIADLFSRKSE